MQQIYLLPYEKSGLGGRGQYKGCLLKFYKFFIGVVLAFFSMDKFKKFKGGGFMH